MSDVVIAAIITVGGMVASNFLLALFWERKRRAEAFFKDFFPERLNAHKEVMRTVTEAGFHDLDPDMGNIAEIKEQLETAVKRLFEASIPNRLFIDDDLAGALLMLREDALAALKKLEEPVSPEAQFIDAAGMYQFHNDQLVELLREKSGIDIINKEFAKVVKRRKKAGKKIKKKVEKKQVKKDIKDEA